MGDIGSSLPQVFVDTDIPVVQEELKALAGLSTKFRTASKVSLTSVSTHRHHHHDHEDHWLGARG